MQGSTDGLLRSSTEPGGAAGLKLSEQALAAIRRQIVEGELAFGEAISETSLAAGLGISKTPVREALMQLRREGLVQIFPKRGTFVFEANPELVAEISDFRLIIELAALERAMALRWGRLVDTCEPIVAAMADVLGRGDLAAYRRLDANLHKAFVAHAGNSFLTEAYEVVEFRIQALRTRLSTARENNVRTLDEHRALLDAIVRRDRPLALDRLRDHIGKTRDIYLEELINTGTS